MPESTPPAAPTPRLGLNSIVAILDELGLQQGYVVNLPTTAAGVYTGSIYPDDLAQQRVIHLDQYSGEPLIDMSYADYGPWAAGWSSASTSTWVRSLAWPISCSCWPSARLSS